MTLPSFLPPGTGDVARWALSRRLQYVGHPDERSLRHWEPFHTMVSPARFFNAVSQLSRPATLTVVEPWTEESQAPPMDRTLLGYVTHPALRGGVSLRVGVHHADCRPSVQGYQRMAAALPQLLHAALTPDSAR